MSDSDTLKTFAKMINDAAGVVEQYLGPDEDAEDPMEDGRGESLAAAIDLLGRQRDEAREIARISEGLIHKWGFGEMDRELALARAEGRAEGIEAAAKECDAVGARFESDDSVSYPWAYQNAAEICAAAIRALSGEGTK